MILLASFQLNSADMIRVKVCQGSDKIIWFFSIWIFSTAIKWDLPPSALKYWPPTHTWWMSSMGRMDWLPFTSSVSRAIAKWLNSCWAKVKGIIVDKNILENPIGKLFVAGADLDITSKDGKSALYFALDYYLNHPQNTNFNILDLICSSDKGEVSLRIIYSKEAMIMSCCSQDITEQWIKSCCTTFWFSRWRTATAEARSSSGSSLTNSPCLTRNASPSLAALHFHLVSD